MNISETAVKPDHLDLPRSSSAIGTGLTACCLERSPIFISSIKRAYLLNYFQQELGSAGKNQGSRNEKNGAGRVLRKTTMSKQEAFSFCFYIVYFQHRVFSTLIGFRTLFEASGSCSTHGSRSVSPRNVANNIICHKESANYG
jgi:hypothetical protein